MFGGKVSGVVTRTDVLGALHKASPDTDSDRIGKSDPVEIGKELLNKLPQQHLDQLALAGEVADSIGVTALNSLTSSQKSLIRGSLRISGSGPRKS